MSRRPARPYVRHALTASSTGLPSQTQTTATLKVPAFGKRQNRYDALEWDLSENGPKQTQLFGVVLIQFIFLHQRNEHIGVIGISCIASLLQSPRIFIGVL